MRSTAVRATPSTRAGRARPVGQTAPAYQAHLADIRLRLRPGNHRGQVLHLVGGDNRVIGFKMHRLRAPRGRALWIDRFAYKERIETDDALAQRHERPDQRDRIAGRRRQSGLAARVRDDRQPPGRMGGQEPDDGNGVAGPLAADHRVHDRVTFAALPPTSRSVGPRGPG